MPASAPLTSVAHGRILLVEDNPGDADLVRELLQLSEDQVEDVVHVDSLAGALAVLAEDPGVECVLLDLSLPDADELEGLRRIAAMRADVPVIVLSGNVDRALATAAVQAGAQDYLTKGRVDEDLLVRSIRYSVERKRAAIELARLALHDQLTGLPNRTLLLDRLEHALSRAERRGNGVAVLFIDLDGFKRINDALGHGAGDAVLREVAARLQGVVRPGDTVARLGGDEFTVLCEDVADASVAFQIADRIADVLRPSLELGPTELVLRASVGVALSSPGAATPDELLRDADHAMYSAKRRGGGHCELYRDAAIDTAPEAFTLEAELRRGLDTQLRVHFQPKVRLADGAVLGAEALVRWQHPVRGLVPPGDFIPMAERSGLIVPVGRWVLQEACREAAAWHRAGRPLDLYVNLSPRQVADPALVDDVVSALAGSGMAAERLHLEITETVLMEDVEDNIATLTKLKQLGVGLVLDDFGVGYSSLSYLKRFPIDAIKIDRSFVAGLPEQREEAAIVSAVVNFAGALGMNVIAEGVETPQQVDALVELGCEQAQGFLFSRPLPAEDFAATCLAPAA